MDEKREDLMKGGGGDVPTFDSVTAGHASHLDLRCGGTSPFLVDHDVDFDHGL